MMLLNRLGQFLMPTSTLIYRVLEFAIGNFLFGVMIVGVALSPMLIVLASSGALPMIMNEGRGHEFVSVIDRIPGTLFLFTLLTVMLCLICFWVLVSKAYLRSLGAENGPIACFSLMKKRSSNLMAASIWVVVIAAAVALLGKLIVPAILRDWSPMIDPAVSFTASAIVVWAQVRYMPVFGVAIASNDVSASDCLSKPYSMTSRSWPWMVVAQIAITLILVLVDDIAGYLKMIPAASLPVFITQLAIYLLVWAGLTIGSFLMLTENPIND